MGPPSTIRRSVDIDHPSHLNLLFPQWQGSGPSNCLFYGPNRLAHACTDIGFVHMPVKEKEQLGVSRNILGYGTILSQLDRTKKAIERLNPTSVMVIGGDCGVELAPVSFMNQIHGGNLALVWLDAHADLNTPESSPSKHFHGMPLRTLCGEGEPTILAQCFSSLSPNQVILAGVRQLDPAEQTFIRDHAVTQVSVREMAADPTSICREIRKKVFDNVYIHIDMDVLDPKAYPHVKHPTPHGLKTNVLEKIISEIAASFSVAGLGIVEFTLDRPDASDRPELILIKQLMDLFR